MVVHHWDVCWPEEIPSVPVLWKPCSWYIFILLSGKRINFQVSMFYDFSWKSSSEVFSTVWTQGLYHEYAELSQAEQRAVPLATGPHSLCIPIWTSTGERRNIYPVFAFLTCSVRSYPSPCYSPTALIECVKSVTSFLYLILFIPVPIIWNRDICQLSSPLCLSRCLFGWFCTFCSYWKHLSPCT